MVWVPPYTGKLLIIKQCWVSVAHIIGSGTMVSFIVLELAQRIFVRKGMTKLLLILWNMDKENPMSQATHGRDFPFYILESQGTLLFIHSSWDLHQKEEKTVCRDNFKGVIWRKRFFFSHLLIIDLRARHCLYTLYIY